MWCSHVTRRSPAPLPTRAGPKACHACNPPDPAASIATAYAAGTQICTHATSQASSSCRAVLITVCKVFHACLLRCGWSDASHVTVHFAAAARTCCHTLTLLHALNQYRTALARATITHSLDRPHVPAHTPTLHAPLLRRPCYCAANIPGACGHRSMHCNEAQTHLRQLHQHCECPARTAAPLQ
jgi:hypothetical protein